MNNKIIGKNSLSDKQILELEERLRYVEPIASECIDAPEKTHLRKEACRLLSVNERTLRKWVASYRDGGPLALVRKERSDNGKPRRISDLVVEKAVELLNENPYRSVRFVLGLLRKEPGDIGILSAEIKSCTLYHHIKKTGFSFKRARSYRRNRVYRKFEAEYACLLWQGDARHGISLPHPEKPNKTKMTYLYAWVDDYSRKIMHAQYFWDEKLPRLEESLRKAILRWGIPEKLYCDNGATYASRHFTLIVGNIGSRKIHHPPYQAWCKGKIEIIMNGILSFQREIQLAGVTTIEELNSTLYAWIEMEYNQKLHSSTGQTPNERFRQSIQKHPPKRVTNLDTFNSYFLWEEERVITKYGYISLNKNQYRIRDVGIGEKILVRYDPYDLQEVYVYYKQKLLGKVKAYKFNTPEFTDVPQESKAPKHKVSRAARRYFENVREKYQQAMQSKNDAFSNILKKEDQ
jgi:putative transposase